MKQETDKVISTDEVLAINQDGEIVHQLHHTIEIGLHSDRDKALYQIGFENGYKSGFESLKYFEFFAGLLVAFIVSLIVKLIF